MRFLTKLIFKTYLNLVRRPAAWTCNWFIRVSMHSHKSFYNIMTQVDRDALAVKSLQDVRYTVDAYDSICTLGIFGRMVDFSNAIDVIAYRGPRGSDDLAEIYRWFYLNMLLNMGAEEKMAYKAVKVLFLAPNEPLWKIDKTMAWAKYVCVVDLEQAEFYAYGKGTCGQVLVGDNLSYVIESMDEVKNFYAKNYAPHGTKPENVMILEVPRPMSPTCMRRGKEISL